MSTNSLKYDILKKNDILLLSWKERLSKVIENIDFVKTDLGSKLALPLKL